MIPSENPVASPLEAELEKLLKTDVEVNRGIPLINIPNRMKENKVLFGLILVFGSILFTLGWFILSYGDTMSYFSISYITTVLALVSLFIKSEWLRGILITIFPAMFYVMIYMIVNFSLVFILTHLPVLAIMTYYVVKPFPIEYRHVLYPTLGFFLYGLALTIFQPPFYGTYPYSFPTLLILLGGSGIIGIAYHLLYQKYAPKE